jgi:hypothetical protein
MNTVTINKSDIDISSILKSDAEPKKPNADVSKDAETYLAKLLMKRPPPRSRGSPMANEVKPKEVDEPKMSDIDRQRSIARILKYQDSQYFGEVVRNQLNINYTYEVLAKKNSQQLESILNRIRVAIDRNAIDGFYDNLLGGGTMASEKIITNMGYDLTGFSDNLLKNEQFFVCFERLKIESDLPNIPLSLQMFQIILSVAVLTHWQNKQSVRHKQKIEEVEEKI